MFPRLGCSCKLVLVWGMSPPMAPEAPVFLQAAFSFCRALGARVVVSFLSLLQVLPGFCKSTSIVDEGLPKDEEWEEVLQHRQWLQSAMRGFFCKVAISAQAKQACKAFRWFLMSINCSSFHLRGYGLEASPSDTTVASMLSASGLKCPRHIDLKVTGADMILSNLVC